MSTTGSPGALLRTVIDAPRRLDELSTARVIEQAAELVHKQQKGGVAIGTITPDSIFVGTTSVELRTGATGIAYAAPETGGGKAGDRRSDVYSLGAVLWEALAHERLTLGKFMAPSELNANVPSELDAICKKALSLDPAERFPSAKVMAAELATVLEDAGYPDDSSHIAAYLTDAFPPISAGSALAAKLAATPASSAPAARKELNQTMMGMKPSDLGITPELLKDTAPSAEDAKLVAQPISPAAEAKLVPEPVKPVPAQALHQTMPFGSNAVSASELAVAVAQLTQTPTATPSPDPDAQVPTTLFSKIDDADLTDKQVPKVDPPKAEPPIVAKAPAAQKKAAKKPSIASAETIATPALVPTAKVDDKATTKIAASDVKPADKIDAKPQATLLDEKQLDAPAPSATIAGLPAMPPGSADAPIPKLNADDFATGSGKEYPDGPPEMPAPLKPADVKPAELAAKGSASTTTSASTKGASGSSQSADPSSAVSLPFRSRRDSQGDILFEKWAASTGEHTALDDGHEEDIVEEQRKQKKRLIIGVGGSLAVILVIAITALAFGGKKTPVKKEDATAETGASRTAPDPSTKATDSPMAPTQQPAGVGSDTGSAATGSDTGSAGSAATGSDTGSAAQAVGSDQGSAEVAAAQKLADEAAAKQKMAADEAAKQTEADRVAKEKADADTAKKSEADRIAQEKADAAMAKKTDAERAAQEQADAAAATKAKADEERQAKTDAANAKAEADKRAKAEAAATADAAKLAKADAAKAKAAADKQAKADAAKVAKTEPKKTDKKAAPKKVAKAEPVDPYAEPKRAPTGGGDPAASYKLGFQQFVHGDSAGALQTFRDSLSSSPGYPPTYRGLGLVYEKMGQKGQAKRAFSRYLQLSPDAPDADQIRERMQRL